MNKTGVLPHQMSPFGKDCHRYLRQTRSATQSTRTGISQIDINGYRFLARPPRVEYNNIHRALDDVKGFGFVQVFVWSDIGPLLDGDEHLMDFIFGVLMGAQPHSVALVTLCPLPQEVNFPPADFYDPVFGEQYFFVEFP